MSTWYECLHIYQALQEVAETILPRFTCQGLANLLYGIETLGYRPLPSFVKAFEAITTERLPYFHHRDLSKLLHSMVGAA